MAIDLSNFLGGEKNPAGQKEGLEGDSNWLGQTASKVWGASTPAMLLNAGGKMQEGQNPIEALWNANKDAHADRVDVAGVVANGAATFYSGGQVDARGPINGIKNFLGGDENYTVATDNVQSIGSAVSGNPGDAMNVATNQGMNILKNEGTSFLGGKSGGGIVSSEDVNVFKAANNARQELGNDGFGIGGPKMDMPTLQMPTLGKK